MSRSHAWLRALLLAVVVVAPVASTSCAVRARARIYDPGYRDYHHWDGAERRAYREYWEDRHEQYRDYARLNDDQQREYWEWRHHHPDENRH